MDKKKKRIRISPVTRLEGHAEINIFLNDEGNVENAYFQAAEFRGFERFCQGRPVEEMPRITTRLCGVCPWAHHIASSKCLDDVFKVEPWSYLKFPFLKKVGWHGLIDGKESGLIEAPRGTLIHHYWSDEDGILRKVNLIVATGHNNAGMCMSVKRAAEKLIHNWKVDQGLLNMVESAKFSLYFLF